MLSRRPYCSFKAAQNKLVVTKFSDIDDGSRSSNPDAAQKQHENGRYLKFLDMHSGNHIDVHVTIVAFRTSPNALNEMPRSIVIAFIVCYTILPCCGGHIS